MCDQRQHTFTQSYLTLTASPEADAACAAARAEFQRVEDSLRSVAEQVRAIAASLEPYQPEDPLGEAMCEGRLPRTPVLSLLGAAQCLADEALVPCLRIAKQSTHTTAATCATEFERRKLEDMQREHARMKRERTRLEGEAP